MGLPEREGIMASKYRKYERKEIKKKEMNPMWRGVGCVLFIAVPLLSWGIMTLLLPVVKDTGQVPPELLANVRFSPGVLKLPILGNIALYLASISELWLKLIIFGLVLFVLIVIFSLLYSMVYQVVGPPRYTEMDAPEMERGAKSYKR